MTISDLLTYMAEKKTCSLSMMAIRFNTQESAIEPILDRLIEKGKIRKVSTGNKGCECGRRCGCGTQSGSCDNHVMYQWVE